MHTLTLDVPRLPFDLDLTFRSGQIFCWEQQDGFWCGSHGSYRIRVKQDGNRISWEGMPRPDLIRFLGLDDDISAITGDIRASIRAFREDQDDLFEAAIQAGAGLRILRQDPWDCLVSFICSANSNIPTIGKRISLLSGRFGPLPHSPSSYPVPDRLCTADEAAIRACCTGYRAPYLKETAGRIVADPFLLGRIRDLGYVDAKRELMTLPGVGPKVADCVLLFAYTRFEAVPVDTWIRTIVETGYSSLLPAGSGKKHSYEDLASFCRNYFGRYAGYAQQFLFTSRNIVPLA